MSTFQFKNSVERRQGEARLYIFLHCNGYILQLTYLDMLFLCSKYKLVKSYIRFYAIIMFPLFIVFCINYNEVTSFDMDLKVQALGLEYSNCIYIDGLCDVLLIPSNAFFHESTQSRQRGTKWFCYTTVNTLAR